MKKPPAAFADPTPLTPADWLAGDGEMGRPRIVWAGDHAAMREDVTRLLESQYEVIAVADGEAALQAARVYTPDVVLSDVMLPRMDGLGLLRALRNSPQLGDTPVLLFSARADDDARIEGIEAGADDYLIEPFSARELRARVDAHVRRARIRRKTEQALQRSEERFQSLVAAVAQIVWTTDPEGFVVEDSPTWREFTGQTLEAWRGYGWLDAIHPEDRERTLQIWRQAVAERSVCQLEYRVRTATGTYRWMAVRAVPVLQADGTVREWVGTNTDITERKLSEAALRESEVRYRLVSQAANDAIWDWDLTNHRVSWNDGVQTHFHYTADQIGQDATWWYCTIHPDDRDRVLRGIQSAIDSGADQWQDEFRFRRADGTYADVFERGWITHDEQGAAVRMVGSVLDLTERKRAEQSLIESQRRLQLVSDHVPAMISYVDRDGYYRFNNAQYQEWFGLRPEQVRGKHIREILGEAGYQHRLPYIQRVLEGEMVQFEGPTPHHRNGVRSTEIAYVPDVGPDQQVQGFYVMALDISERKQTEMLLEAQTQSLEMVVSGRPLVEVLTYLAQVVDQQGNGQAVASILLLDEQGKLRNGASPSLPADYLAAIDGLMPDATLGTCASAAATGRVVITPDIDRDPMWQSLKHLPLGIGFRAAWSRPIVARSGRVLGTFGTYFRDCREPSLTERQVVEILARTAALAIENSRADDRLRLLSEAAAVLLAADSPDAMMQGLFAKVTQTLGVDTYFNFMVNESGDALRLSSCFGIPEETKNSIQRLEFGQAICGTVALHRAPIIATRIQQSEDPKAQLVKSFGIQAYACNPLLYGEKLLGTLSFASRSQEQFDPEELSFLATLSHYVTIAYIRLQLVERLRDADRRKDEFLATLAHELRNPLAPIRSGLELMKLVKDSPEILEETRCTMERQTHQLIALVDDLLDVSRITRGKLQLRKCRVLLADVVRSAVEAARPFVDEAGHQLQVDLPSRDIVLDADPHRLAQVVSNLLNNAAKYTPEGGRIALKAVREGSDLVVTISDTGIGVPPEMLERIFEMFAQIDRPHEQGHAGLGIGLTLVKLLVEMHGGSVRVESPGIGQGTTFTVRLPIAVEAQPAADLSPQAVTPSDGERIRHRVLVVDDNRAAAQTLSMVVKLLGNEVRTAADGVQAIQLAEEFQPDVILMDLGMPRMNGYEAARHIRQQPWGSTMVLVALTGWGQDEDKQRTQEAGFDHHLVKPAEPSDLQKLFGHFPTRSN